MAMSGRRSHGASGGLGAGRQESTRPSMRFAAGPRRCRAGERRHRPGDGRGMGPAVRAIRVAGNGALMEPAATLAPTVTSSPAPCELPRQDADLLAPPAPRSSTRRWRAMVLQRTRLRILSDIGRGRINLLSGGSCLRIAKQSGSVSSSPLNPRSAPGVKPSQLPRPRCTSCRHRRRA
jgi:hypothetical protein